MMPWALDRKSPLTNRPRCLPLVLVVFLPAAACSSQSGDGRDAAGDGQGTAEAGPSDMRATGDSTSGPPTASGPRLTGSVTEIDFGAVPLGTLVTNFLVVTNGGGTQSAPLAAMLPMTADFRARTNCSGRRLASQETCVVTIEFQPTTVGPKMAAGQVSQAEGTPMPVSYTVRGAGRIPPDAAPDVARDAADAADAAAADGVSLDSARDTAVDTSSRDAASDSASPAGG